MELGLEARPMRVYVVDSKTNKIDFMSGPGPFMVSSKQLEGHLKSKYGNAGSQAEVVTKD
jgi:hypothetical protein